MNNIGKPPEAITYEQLKESIAECCSENMSQTGRKRGEVAAVEEPVDSLGYRPKGPGASKKGKTGKGIQPTQFLPDLLGHGSLCSRLSL